MNVKAVVVGAGAMSNAWFSVMKLENVEVVGVVDINLDAAKAKIEQHELAAPASTDLKKMLKSSKPDIVVDVTVPEAHCDVTIAAMKAGCHVVGEKPMASSMSEARKMVKTADETGMMYMVGQSRRWDQKHDTLRQTVGAGAVGTVTTMNCDFYIGAHFGGFRDEMPSPLILDMSIHHFDLARFLTGLDPVAVYAREFNPKGSWYKGDVAASCIFEMSNDVVFTYAGSWCAEGCPTSWNGDWRIIGDKGTVVYDHDNEPHGQIAVGKTGFGRELADAPITQSSMAHFAQHGALREMLDFLRTGKKPQTECHDNIKSLAMVFAAIESSQKGKRVPVRVM